MKGNLQEIADFELKFTRLIEAPREKVFNAWAQPETMIQWYGPKDWPGCSIETDFRPGGAWQATLRSVEDGSELHQGGVYKEIVRPELIIFTFAWDNHPDPNIETLVTIRFEEQGEHTKMHFSQRPFYTESSRDGHSSGWNSSFDRLDSIFNECTA